MAVLLLVSLAAASPAAAFKFKFDRGKTGFVEVVDDPGVHCFYEEDLSGLAGGTSKELDYIRVIKYRVRGPYARESWVGSRFIIKANTKPYGDGKYKTIAKSKIFKRRASKGTRAKFRHRTWMTPENHRTRYRVQLEFFFYAKGSKTKIVGRTKGAMERYIYLSPSVVGPLTFTHGCLQRINATL